MSGICISAETGNVGLRNSGQFQVDVGATPALLLVNRPYAMVCGSGDIENYGVLKISIDSRFLGLASMLKVMSTLPVGG